MDDKNKPKWSDDHTKDVELSGLENQERLRAHKCILAEKMQYFKDDHGNEKTFEFKTIKERILKTLVHCCYFGSFDRTDDDYDEIGEIMRAVIILGMDDLQKDISENDCLYEINTRNCVDLYFTVAKEYKKLYANFIKENGRQVLDDEIYRLTFNEMKELMTLISLEREDIKLWASHPNNADKEKELMQALPNAQENCKGIFVVIKSKPTSIRTYSNRDYYPFSYIKSFDNPSFIHLKDKLFFFSDKNIAECVSLETGQAIQLKRTLQPFKQNKRDVGMIALDDKIYAIGGYITHPINNTTSEVETLDPETYTWFNKAEMPIAKSGVALAIWKNYIFCVGGKDNEKTVCRTVHSYNTEKDEWVELPSMAHARYKAGIIVLNDTIIVIGGGSDTIEQYNCKEHIWTMKSVVSMSKAISTCVQYGDSLFAFGKQIVMEFAIADLQKSSWEPFFRRLDSYDIIGSFVRQ